MPTTNTFRPIMQNNMAAQNFMGPRQFNLRQLPHFPPQPLMNNFGLPVQNNQAPQNYNHQWYNMNLGSSNNYPPQPNPFQYRPNTRFSVQHLRTRRVSRTSRSYHRSGSYRCPHHYHSDDSDDDSSDHSRERLRNIRRLNRLNSRYHDPTHTRRNSNRVRRSVDTEEEVNHSDSEDDICFLCEEALRNCAETSVHMCNGGVNNNGYRELYDDRCNMEVCENQNENNPNKQPEPCTSAFASNMEQIEKMKSALSSEKSEVCKLRKDAYEFMMKLKEKEKILDKKEKELAAKGEKISAEHEANKIEIKRMEKQLEDECKRMEAEHDTQKGRIKLDVGGHIFTTSTTTLCIDGNSMLAAMFSGRHEIIKQQDGTVFIDRDGTHFRYILNYLRDGPASLDTLPRPRHVLKELRNEASFYQLPGLVQSIETLLA